MKKKIIILALFFLLIDIITKLIIDKSFNLMETYSLIPNFFYLTKIYNYGASWNILSGHVILLVLVTFIMLGIIYFYQKSFLSNKRNNLAFALLYAGIIGNLLNRIIYGYVIDFLDFKIIGYNFPVFNIADIEIFMGIVLLIIAIYKKEDEYGNNS